MQLSIPPNSILEPFAVSKKEAIRLIGSSALVKRLIHAALHNASDPWIKILPAPGVRRETYIDFQSLRQAYQRIVNGELPPQFPSEKRR